MKSPRDKTATSRIMASIRSRDTEPEILLGKAMWALKLRYRKQWKIAGKPDFAFPGLGIAVFCDGDFWHGNNWRIRHLNSFTDEIAEYTPFWQNKLHANINHDENINRKLFEDGWIVIRFWESSIRKNPQACAQAVASTVIFHKSLRALK